MIDDIRYIEKRVMVDERIAKTVKQLQVSVGKKWFDVPTVEEAEPQDILNNMCTDQLDENNNY